MRYWNYLRLKQRPLHHPLATIMLIYYCSHCLLPSSTTKFYRKTHEVYKNIFVFFSDRSFNSYHVSLLPLVLDDLKKHGITLTWTEIKNINNIFNIGDIRHYYDHSIRDVIQWCLNVAQTEQELHEVMSWYWEGHYQHRSCNFLYTSLLSLGIFPAVAGILLCKHGIPTTPPFVTFLTAVLTHRLALVYSSCYAAT